MMRGRLGRRQRRSRDHDAQRGRALTLGGIVLVISAAVAWASFTRELPFVGGGGEVVMAEFAAARQVTDRTPVRVAGVEVGSVTDVSPLRRGRAALIEMRLTEPVELRQDARAELRFRTLLGGAMEISLFPGSPGAPPLGDEPIELARTGIQTEVDDITTIYRGSTVRAQRGVLREVPRAFRGGEVRRALRAFGPQLRPVAAAASALRGERSDDLEALIQSTSRAVRALTAERTPLRGLVTGAQRTFRSLANTRDALGSAFELAPAALDSTRRAARAVDELRPTLDEAIDGLHPSAALLASATEAARPAFRQAASTLRKAKPLLQELEPAVERVANASITGNRVLDGLRPSLRLLNSNILPWLARPQAESGMPVHQLIGPAIALVGNSAAAYDKFGNLVGFPSSVAGGGQALGLPEPGDLVPLLGRSCASLARDASSNRRDRCLAVSALFRRIFGGAG